MLASFLKRDLKYLIQRDASPNFQAQNGLLSLRSWWRSVRSLQENDSRPLIGRDPYRPAVGFDDPNSGRQVGCFILVVVLVQILSLLFHSKSLGDFWIGGHQGRVIVSNPVIVF